MSVARLGLHDVIVSAYQGDRDALLSLVLWCPLFIISLALSCLSLLAEHTKNQTANDAVLYTKV